MSIVIRFTHDQIVNLLQFLKTNKIENYYFDDEYLCDINDQNYGCVININKNDWNDLQQKLNLCNLKIFAACDENFNIDSDAGSSMAWIPLVDTIIDKKLQLCDIQMTPTLKKLFDDAIWMTSEAEGNMRTLKNTREAKKYLRDLKIIQKFFKQITHNIS